MFSLKPIFREGQCKIIRHTLFQTLRELQTTRKLFNKASSTDGIWAMRKLKLFLSLIGGNNKSMFPLKKKQEENKRFRDNIEDQVEDNLHLAEHVKQEVSFLRTARDILQSLNSIQGLYGSDFTALASIHTLSLHYYLEACEGIKTPSWKRRSHMFKPKINKNELEPLCLYGGLAALSYDAIQRNDLEHLVNLLYENSSFLRKARKDTAIGFLALLSRELDQAIVKPPKEKQVKNSGINLKGCSKWKIVKASVAALSSKPAHILMSRELSSGETECIILIRGTDSLEDLVTSANLSYDRFLDGHAHVGMKAAGEWIAETYGAYLSQIEAANSIISNGRKGLFTRTVKTPPRIKFIGHSMGGGACVVAAHLLKHKKLVNNVEVITFGCPPLFNREMSEKCSDFVTSVVLDDDLVPRLTDVSVKSLGNDLLSFDWKRYLERDVDAFFAYVQEKMPGFIPKKHVESWSLALKTKVLAIFPSRSKRRATLVDPSTPLSTVGTVPGRIIHLYETGRGYAATQVNPDAFDEIHFLRSMLDDHKVDNYFAVLRECN